jgi:HD superfamily phosphohydrolase
MNREGHEVIKDRGDYKVIRDPVHYYITISGKEKEVIDLPIFQRLRRIHQLSFADLVYPGAVHTRFSHSLGAMELAKRVAQHLRAKEIINEEDEEVLIWAALLHDIGHFPFSHAFEPAYSCFVKNEYNVKRVYKAHEEMACEIIRSSEYQIKEIIGDDKIVERVCRLISDDLREPELLRNIICGFFSVDRLDYIKRDAYHCGTLEYAGIDPERVLSSIEVQPGYGKRVAVYEKRALYALESALFSYFNMYRAVYYHKTVRAAFLLFQDILWRAFEKGIFKDVKWNSPEFFVGFDENKCIQMLMEDKEIAEELTLLLERRLPKMVRGLGLRTQDTIKNVCQDVKNKVDKERYLCGLLQKQHPTLKFLFIDFSVLLPYPAEAPRILIFDGREVYRLESLAPYITQLDQAWKHEEARVYVVSTDRLDKDNNFISALDKAIIDYL